MFSASTHLSFRKTAVLLTIAFAASLLPALSRPLNNKEVLVVFNSADPESERLANFYCEARDIPPAQVIGLSPPAKADITRAEFNSTILTPLREHFEEKGYWQRTQDSQGVLLPSSNRIRAIVLMKGMPLRIAPEPVTPPVEGEKPPAPPADPISPRDEASVDSELALFGVETLPSKGVLKNAFFESKLELASANAPFFVLVTRIDAPAYITCKKMITDSIAAEKTGLWGRAYVDVANKFPQGDQWLNDIIAQHQKLGIPTVTDSFNDTLPTNYPMTDAAIYYGWYDWNVSGPFLNPSFLFRPGAIAIHLHSFSAQQLTDPHKNWSGPLLTRGAAATVGNVYEPYLHLTHHFEILQDRLLKGWTLAEAAWAAMPVTSWQGIVLGDPLYRPFLHLDGTGEKRNEDRDYRALAAASREWSLDDALRRSKLAAAAEKLSSGILAEGLALDFLESKDTGNARIWFTKAKELFPEKEDKLRQDLQLIAILRADGNKPAAIAALREAQATYATISGATAIAGWLDILDPPPPPAADPT
ncbi:MAG: TIGR03790 family protein, partial [Akkermansiaceae bacterium]|nr:TIGR03790 family protein [Akkermansiaceae bacterium]MDP4721804.1 TIGR03790 family protein [Akkermansiaceae bacterium]MDP4780545.1 TIGR03790 family protein [Akkermansiaceae bacterium]MDP4847391.1 TIGR03790 family protein [Akkermansiaceae bacterium]MDP4897706.1 TIGR03790 family protein [Akkermansiaceae bacterium]